jgi:hypothetical protein
MNSIERKARFTELMATIELLPSIEDENYEPKFPQGTLGLSDGRLKTAIMVQAMKNDEEFQGNLINALANTGLEACQQKHMNGEMPNEDDIATVCMAIHIAWAAGALSPMLIILGIASKMFAVCDIEIPDDLTLIFRPNQGMKDKAPQLDPIALLELDKDGLFDLLKKGYENDDSDE